MKMEKIGFLDSSVALFKSRKEIVFAVTWTATLATIIAGKGLPPLTPSVLSIIAMMMLSISVYIYNDTVDQESDSYSEQEKKKGRPVSNGTVSETNAMRFVYVTGILGLGLCYMLSRVVFLIGFTYYTLFFLYSYPRVRFKEMYVVKNLVTSFLMPAGFLIGGAAVENTISPSIAFLAFTYYTLTVLVIPAIADMLDYEEDKAFNVRTIGNTLSWKQNLILYNIGILVLVTGSVVSYLLFDFSYFLPIFTSVIGISLMAYSYNLRNESGLTASYKLRPVTYVLVLLNPLLLALGAVF
jgi:4-hydroxybenzoate polyprenyltransferase